VRDSEAPEGDTEEPNPLGDELASSLKEALADERFAVGTIVRAGDFLLRKGFVTAAEAAARYGVERGQGLLAAYVLGMRCAVAKGDADWALSCALAGAEAASDPAPFYKAIVDIKSLQRDVDGDMIAALEYMQEHAPAETEWPQRLGHVYFQQGDPRRAFSVLEPVIESDAGSVRVQSLLLASEAARLQGKRRAAIQILEKAYSMHPESLAVLNNLVYNLAQEEATLPRARALLPKLLATGEESFAAQDTVAMVHLRSGNLQQAQLHMDMALALLDEQDYAAAEVNLNAATILYRLGQYHEARKRVHKARHEGRLTAFVDRASLELLREIEEQIGE
jgi:Tfp pilus assembly protein PilF